MRTYVDPETGYLFIEDVSEGCDIMSTDEFLGFDNDYGNLEKTVIQLETKVEMLKEMLDKERKTNNQLLASIGVLYDRLETVKNAHYIEGYADGAWQLRHRELSDVGKQLQKDVASFPKLLESALSDIKNIISNE